MSSDLDIGDIEKEEFNSEYNSESKSSSDSSDDSGEKSKKNNLRDQIEEINQSKEEKDETPEKEQTTEKEKKEEKEGKEGKEGKERKEEKEEKDDNEEKDEHEKKREKKKSQQNKNKDNKIKEIKLNKKDDKSSKSSKTKSKESNDKKNGSDKGSGITDDNNRIIKKEISEHSLADNENKFFIPQYNQRLETLMNIISEKSSESDVNYKRRIKIENEIIRKEKRARKRYKKVDDIQFQIIGYPQTVNQIKKNEEYKLQKEKIKYLEAKNLELDRLNQMYYDLIRSTNYDIIKDNIDNYNYNNNLKLQSLDYINNNNINRIPNPLNKLSQDNLDFAIQNYIDGERNKNIHNFNDSMIDINQKITNYLIDNCQEVKEKNKNLEDFKYEIGNKLDKIEHIQKQQKHDIDFIIKYGLNKNKALDPIIGLLYDYQRPLPKLLKDIDEENKLDKIINEKNFNSYKNFSLYGRYSNKRNDKENDNSDDKSKKTGGILRRTGSCVFENRRNPFNKKLKENEEYKKLNPDIKNPFFENKGNKEKNKNYNDDNYEDEEFQKFVAYKGRYFIPADFRFGGVKDKNQKHKKPKKNKNEIDFII